MVEINEDASGHRFSPNEGLPPLAFVAPTSYTECDAALRDFAHYATQSSRTNHTQQQNTISESHALQLMCAIHERVQYVTGSTHVHTTATQAFAQNMGVCQDQAHIYLACARAMGIPARYVSGYLNTGDLGHVASHAWVDVYTDKHEWLSLDITHNCITDGRHCRLAVGRDYDTAAPVRGTRVGGGMESLQAVVHVSAQNQ
jgi:Transglutaminase-like superfamily